MKYSAILAAAFICAWVSTAQAQTAQDQMRALCFDYWESLGEKNQTVIQSRCLCLDKLIEKSLTPRERTLYMNESALRRAPDIERDRFMSRTRNLRDEARRECRFPADR